MQRAPVQSKATRHSSSVSRYSLTLGVNGKTIAPPRYGVDFLDQQQSTGEGEYAGQEPSLQYESRFPFREAFPLASPPMQAKLTVSQPGDPYEQEADRIAEQAMRMPGPMLHGVGIAGGDEKDSCHACEIRKKGLLQRQATLQDDSLSHTLPESFGHELGSGRPLAPAVRQEMENKFRQDFSRVRIHTNDRAAESAKSINALAYTRGSDIVFSTGQYSSGTSQGQKLLAHELTHVVQQLGVDRINTGQSNNIRELSLAPHDTSSSVGQRLWTHELTHLVQGVESADNMRQVESAQGSSKGKEERGSSLSVFGNLAPVNRRVAPRVMRQQEGKLTEQRQEDDEPGFFGTIGAGLMGEFNEDPNFAMIGVDISVSLIPILDQASDVRDIIAHLYYMIFRRQYDRFMRWLGLVFTLIGLIPVLGSVIKGASKFIIRGVEVLIARLADFVRPLVRLLPDAADLGRLQAFVAHNWSHITAEGMAAWNRTADRVSRFVAVIPRSVGGQLRVLRELWNRVVEVAPARLIRAFAWIKQRWDSVLDAVRHRLGSARNARSAAPKSQQSNFPSRLGQHGVENAAEGTARIGRITAAKASRTFLYRGTVYRWMHGRSSQVHDLGDGVYFTFDHELAVRYAQERRIDVQAMEPGAPGVVLRVEVTSTELGKVFDFYNDRTLRKEWETFLRRMPYGEVVLRGGPSELYNGHFSNWLWGKGLEPTQFDVIIGPEYIRGGSQVCVHDDSLANQLLKRAEEGARVHEPTAPTY